MPFRSIAAAAMVRGATLWGSYAALACAVVAMPALGGCGSTALTRAQTVEPAQAASARSARYTITRTTEAQKWTRIERLTSEARSFPVERSRRSGRQRDAEIVAAFGSAEPDSRHVLLHYHDGWNQGAGVPVLLVHGAIVDATSAWIEPHGKEGLAKYLAAQGFRVFAVTFAHRHGDNFGWAEQVGNALARIREVTGAKHVDVLAHSKGTIAVRALASNFKQPWMAPYQGDIRRFLSVGGAHLGIDYSFRHPVVNYGLYPEQDDPRMNAPLSWTRMLRWGRWVDTSELTATGGFFPGQAQLLYRWDDQYPLIITQPDWYTTYHGGRGFVSQSEGIDKAIARGGNFIAKLREKPLAKDVELHVLAGNRATMKNVLNEKSGPSDGVVFVKSATATADMTRGGAKLVRQDVLALNHMELIYAPAAKAWVMESLGR